MASTAATLTFGSPDADAADFRCRLDGSPWAPCQSASTQNYVGLSDGEHTFSVRSTRRRRTTTHPAVAHLDRRRDAAADVDRPRVPRGTVRNTTADFQIASDDSDADFECALDGGAFSACTETHQVTGLTDGPHVLAARADR